MGIEKAQVHAIVQIPDGAMKVNAMTLKEEFDRVVNFKGQYSAIQ